MSDTAISQQGKHLLQDLAVNNEQQQGSRAIRGGGSTFPNVSAHSWNVDAQDFVPSGGGSGVDDAGASVKAGGDLSQAQLMVRQAVAALRGAEREQCDQQLNDCLRVLYSAFPTHEALATVARFAIDLAKADQTNCEPVANVLAFLALNFCADNMPQLKLEKSSQLARYPVYAALLRLCSEENERIRREIATKKRVEQEHANYVVLFSCLYICLPSVKAQSERQSAIAKETLVYLCQLVDLHSCPLAYSTLHAVLMMIGVPLDVDCADCAEAGDRENAQMLTDFYEKLRLCLARGQTGSPDAALDLIRLLELRSAGWNRSAGFQPDLVATSLSATSAESQNMTDDMYADYEQFLRESGQL